MKTRSVFRLGLIAALIFISLLAPTHSVTAQEGQDEPPPPPMRTATGEMLGIRPIQVYADPNQSTFFQSPPQEFMTAAEMGPSLTSATFVIDYVPAGQFNWFDNETPCSTFPAEAKTALNYAASIWASILNPVHNVPIHIQACWQNMGEANLLGYGGSAYYHTNFANAPLLSTWYPDSLANSLAGVDISPGYPEMVLAYNSQVASYFYYGTSSTPYDKINLATVALQQITHGLGFSGSMYVEEDGYGEWGFSNAYVGPLPEIYDHFTVDYQNRQLLNTTVYPNPSIILGDALKSNAIFFNGTNAKAANGGQRVKLYAPSEWDYGSSYTSLDNIYDGTPNALMTPFISWGETNYNPGPITKGILADVGWNIPSLYSSPTGLALSKSSVNENAPVGTTIGTFTSSDPNAGDTFTYSLVAGVGSADNAAFSIAANSLKTNAAINYEAKSSYSIRVRTADQTGRFYEKAFIITITNVNEAPTALALSNSSVAENQPVNTLIGTLSTTDPDSGNTHTYSLGCAAADNNKVKITGNSLVTSLVLNHEAKQSLTVCIRSTDQGSLYKDQVFTLALTNVNEVPTAVALSNSIIPENQPVDTLIGTLSTTDPDSGNTHTYTLACAGADNAKVKLAGNTLLTNALIDYESKTSLKVCIRSTDQGSLYKDQVLTITVNNVNEAASEIYLTPNIVRPGTLADARVGSLTANDPDYGDTLTFSLAPGFGDNSKFVVVGDQLRTAEVMDLTEGTTYSIQVQVNDAEGTEPDATQTLSITVMVPYEVYLPLMIK